MISAADVVYLDHGATTPVEPRVGAAMERFASREFGNPSSSHRLGRPAREAMEVARAQVAELFGCLRDEVIFTGSASEANNLATKGAVWHQRGARHLITTAAEHPCVLESCRVLAERFDCELTVLGVDESGAVDPQALRAALTADTRVVSVMLANNEVGTLNPLGDIATIAAGAGVPLHSDAVAAAGWLELDREVGKAAMVSISGHKIYGPKGIGALKVAHGIDLVPLVHGGGQEFGLRSGTEGVAQVVGLGEAAALCADRKRRARRAVSALRDRLIARISEVRGARLTGHRTRRLPNHASFVFAGVDGKQLLDQLNSAGVVASSGSACSSRKLTSSHVLEAMGIPAELAQASLRLTLGVHTTEAEIDRACEVIEESVAGMTRKSRVATAAQAAEG